MPREISGGCFESFYLYDGDCFLDNHSLFTADLALSLDVIYHLVEDPVYEHYMDHLFGAARRFVIIYSSDYDEVIPHTHVRHRQFSHYVASHFPKFQLIDHLKQRYPIEIHGGGQGSFADFYVYERAVLEHP